MLVAATNRCCPHPRIRRDHPPPHHPAGHGGDDGDDGVATVARADAVALPAGFPDARGRSSDAPLRCTWSKMWLLSSPNGHRIPCPEYKTMKIYYISRFVCVYLSELKLVETREETEYLKYFF